MACRGAGGSRVRLAAAEEPAVAERAAERELGGLELLRGRLAPERLGAAEVALDALAVDEQRAEPVLRVRRPLRRRAAVPLGGGGGVARRAEEAGAAEVGVDELRVGAPRLRRPADPRRRAVGDARRILGEPEDEGVAPPRLDAHAVHHVPLVEDGVARRAKGHVLPRRRARARLDVEAALVLVGRRQRHDARAERGDVEVRAQPAALVGRVPPDQRVGDARARAAVPLAHKRQQPLVDQRRQQRRQRRVARRDGARLDDRREEGGGVVHRVVLLVERRVARRREQRRRLGR